MQIDWCIEENLLENKTQWKKLVHIRHTIQVQVHETDGRASKRPKERDEMQKFKMKNRQQTRK